MPQREIEVIGRQFGKLLAVRKSDKVGRTLMVECLCECGNTKTVRKGNLLNGNTTSCGCKDRYANRKRVPAQTDPTPAEIERECLKIQQEHQAEMPENASGFRAPRVHRVLGKR